MSKKLISYVLPVYNEELNIPNLQKELIPEIDKYSDKYDFEIICINDGSKDSSLEKLLELNKVDSRFKIINFSRNFGHQIAITAGIDHAKGDAVIIMDSDLQDPPSVSFDLIKKWEEGYEVVYAQRRTRKDTPFKKLTAYMFYRTLDKLADIRIPKDTGDFRLIDRKVVDTIKQFREHNRFMRGMISYVGFKQIPVQFERRERTAGVTNYPLKKMIKLALDGIFSFSNTPLRYVTSAAIALITIGTLMSIAALVANLRDGSAVIPVWYILVALGTIFTGIQVFALGVVGMYIGRIHSAVLGRPLYIISSVTE